MNTVRKFFDQTQNMGFGISNFGFGTSTKNSRSSNKLFWGVSLMGFSLMTGASALCIGKKEFLNEEQLGNLLRKYPNVKVVDQNLTRIQYSIIRDKKTSTKDFRLYSDRIMRILLEAAFNQLPQSKVERESPLCAYTAYELKEEENIIAVTIMRAGNSFLHELLNIMPKVDVGQILLQRNENSQEKEPIFYFAKMPNEMKGKRVILLDPMLASAGSVKKAIEILTNLGVAEEKITFVNLIACEVGLKNLTTAYPQVKVITGAIDPQLLQDSKYIAPGLGDFGDRYYGTIQPHQIN